MIRVQNNLEFSNLTDLNQGIVAAEDRFNVTLFRFVLFCFVLWLNCPYSLYWSQLTLLNSMTYVFPIWLPVCENQLFPEALVGRGLSS